MRVNVVALVDAVMLESAARLPVTKGARKRAWASFIVELVAIAWSGRKNDVKNLASLPYPVNSTWRVVIETNKAVYSIKNPYAGEICGKKNKYLAHATCHSLNPASG